MRANLQGMAAELGVSKKEFSEVFSSGLAIYNAEENCVFIPNFIKYQGCESLNVLKSWVKQIQFIPHGKLKDKAVDTLYAFVQGKGEAFLLAFHDAYLKAYKKEFGLAKAYPVSSKQLAVSSNKPSLPNQAEAVTTVGGRGATALAIDPDTGEVISWAA